MLSYSADFVHNTVPYHCMHSSEAKKNTYFDTTLVKTEL